MKKQALAVTALVFSLIGLASPAAAQYIPQGAVTTGNPASPIVFGGGPTNTGYPVFVPGQYQQDGRTYNPVNRQEVYIQQSGCSSNTGNALLCMLVQGVVQAGVNRSAIREQAAGTIRVERARFTLGQDAGSPAGYTPAAAGPQMVNCTLTMPDGRSQTMRMTLGDCQAEAQRLGTTAQRRN